MDRGERRAPDRRRAASSEASIVVSVVPPWAGVGTERILNGPRRQVRRAGRCEPRWNTAERVVPSQFRYRYNARRKRWPKHLGAAEIRMNAQVWPNSGQWGGDGTTFPGHLAAMPDEHEGPGGRRRGGAPGQWRSQGSLVDGHTSHARRFPSASMPPPAACALSFNKLRHRAVPV